MNDKFDELAKAMAQPVARRAALKKFGVGCAAVLLTAFGLAPRADATPSAGLRLCATDSQCPKGMKCKLVRQYHFGMCVQR
jgi:hypothetical protein